MMIFPFRHAPQMMFVQPQHVWVPRRRPPRVTCTRRMREAQRYWTVVEENYIDAYTKTLHTHAAACVLLQRKQRGILKKVLCGNARDCVWVLYGWV